MTDQPRSRRRRSATRQAGPPAEATRDARTPVAATEPIEIPVAVPEADASRTEVQADPAGPRKSKRKKRKPGRPAGASSAVALPVDRLGLPPNPPRGGLRVVAPVSYTHLTLPTLYSV